MRIIDFHNHVYPDAIAAKAVESVCKFYQLGNQPMDGTTATLLALGSQAGITDYVILPVAMKPERTRHINQFILEQTKTHPEFIGFGAMHAAMENMGEEVDYLLQQRFYGVKLHPDSQGFAIDDPRLFPMYEQVQGKLPVLLHMGDNRMDYSHPRRLRHVLEIFPDLQVIAAHFGGYSMYELAYETLRDTDCFFDVSSSLMFLGEGQAERYILGYGAERFVYGTDYPMWNPVEEMERFCRLKLTDDQFEQIFHITAESLLRI